VDRTNTDETPTEFGLPPDVDPLHLMIRSLVEERDRYAHLGDRPKYLLDRLAERHKERDVELLDWFVNEADVQPALRKHAVGLLLGLGYPHALRVSPEALAVYHSAPRRPYVSLVVMCLYLVAELWLLLQLFDGRITEGSRAIVTASTAVHLSIWTLSVFGAVFLLEHPSWNRTCRVLAWLLWLFPILTLLSATTAFGAWGEEYRLLGLGIGVLGFLPGIAASLRIATFHAEPAAPQPPRLRQSAHPPPQGQ
jgi:hypothetical protein